jgi:hypothetical protein
MLQLLRKVQKITTGILIALGLVYLILYYLTKVRETIPESWVMIGELLGFGVEWMEPSTKLSKSIDVCDKYKQLCDILYEEYNHVIDERDPTRCIHMHILLGNRLAHYEKNYNLEKDRKGAEPLPHSIALIDAAEREHEADAIGRHVAMVRNGAIKPRRLSVARTPAPAAAELGLIPESEPCAESSNTEDFVVPAVSKKPSSSSSSYSSSGNFSVVSVGQPAPAQDEDEGIGVFPPL